MKKRVVIGVAIAAVVLTIGVVADVLLGQTWSAPEVVRSVEPVPEAIDVCNASWNPGGSAILYASSLKEGRVQSIYTIDLDGGNLRCLGEGRLPVWSPDGLRIAFATDNSLEVMNSDGGERVLLVDLARVAAAGREVQLDSTAWSPDGSMIAFSVSPGTSENPDPSIGGIWVVHADGNGLRHLTTGVEDLGLAWSPDNERIAFVSYGNGGKWDVWVSRVDGGELRQLTASDEMEFDTAWSPDGSKLAFASHGWRNETGPAIWAMDADGSNKTQLMEVSGWPSHPSWSPDGAKLAFCSGSGDIWMINADGSGKTRLTNTSASRASAWFACSRTSIRYKEPQWSPDGTKLLFLNSLTKETHESGNVIQGESSGYDRLWVMELDLEKGLD